MRQNPTVVNNVTTYDAVSYPSNRDGALRPGMTANVQITVAKYPDATIVPLAALQWHPSAAVQRRYRIIAPGTAGEGIPRNGSAWGTTGTTAAFAISVGRAADCYVLDGKTLHGISLRVLAIDGTRVGVRPLSGSLKSGDAVVVDDDAAR